VKIDKQHHQIAHLYGSFGHSSKNEGNSLSYHVMSSG